MRVVPDPKEAFSAAQDWAVIGFQHYTSRQPSKSERGVILRASLAALHLYLRQRADDLGLLYTFGYAVSGADAVIEQLAALDVLITDVRCMARSHAAKWRKAALQGRLGTSYLRLRALGNVNYRQPGDIQLFQPETGVPLASDQLRQGQHLALMCWCLQLDGCHRTTATDLLIARLPALSFKSDMGSIIAISRRSATSTIIDPVLSNSLIPNLVRASAVRGCGRASILL